MIQEILDILNRDDRNRLKVKLPNGVGALVFCDREYYPEEATYRIEIHEGWAEGVTETICDMNDPWLVTNYLKDAKVYEDRGCSWSQIK